MLQVASRQQEAQHKYCMRISEIESIKPKTPEQSRVDSLQATAKCAQQAVNTERAKQQLLKAQQGVAKLRQPNLAVVQERHAK